MKFGFGVLLVVALLAAPGSASASTYHWSGNATGDWNVPANWILVNGPAGAGYPNLPGDLAYVQMPPVQTTITIPDAVTVTVGQVIITGDQSVTIASGGSGLLVFDNAGENAYFVANATIASRVDAPIRLNSDLDVTVGSPSLVFAGGISEASAGRSVIRRSASGTLVYGPAANSYTGPTIVRLGTLGNSGKFSTAPADPTVVTVPGDLEIEGTAEIHAGALAPGADVIVYRQLEFLSNGDAPQSQTIDALTVSRGNTLLNRVVLDAATLTMEGGDLRMGLDAGLVVRGAIAATSVEVPAKIRGEAGASGSLRLDGGGNHALTIADGLKAIDAIIAVPILGTAGEGLIKQGAGRAAFLGNNTYTGPTIVAAGTLYINGEQPASAVTISGGTLGGLGIAGAITATSGSIAPGGTISLDGGLSSINRGTLRSGSLTLGTGTTFEIDLALPVAGASDQLDVTGTVDVTNATLSVITDSIARPAPLATITIIKNDGTDPVQGAFAGLPEGAAIILQGGVKHVISYRGGDGNDVVLTHVTPLEYFLSEGSTGTFFEEHVLIANANTVEAPITLTFLLPGGGTVVQSRVVRPQSRLTLNVADIPGLAAVSASVRVVSDGGVPLAVERTMFWDHTRYGGHTDSAIPAASNTWLFAEGSQGFFDTFLLLANANGVPAETTITFLREFDPPVTDTVMLEPFSRRTIYAGDYPGLVDKSFGISVSATQPITAERAMYFGSTPTRLWSGGHNTHGTTSGGDSWFPEGATGSFFSTFILLSNPSNGYQPFRITFFLPDGQQVTRTDLIAPQQRMTINPAFESPLLANASFSTFVQSLPIGFTSNLVAERAMYWPGEALPWGEGHVNHGTPLATVWDLAEGRVGGPEEFATYILIVNPRSTPGDVTVTFLRETGAPIVKNYTIGAGSRFNIDVAAMVPELQNENVGARVVVTTPNGAIAVERSMYWNVNGVTWAGGTNASGTPQQP